MRLPSQLTREHSRVKLGGRLLEFLLLVAQTANKDYGGRGMSGTTRWKSRRCTHNTCRGQEASSTALSRRATFAQSSARNERAQ